VQEGYGELEAKAEELKALKLTTDQLISESDTHTQNHGEFSDDTAAELRARLDRLDKLLDDVRAKADKHKVPVF